MVMEAAGTAPPGAPKHLCLPLRNASDQFLAYFVSINLLHLGVNQRLGKVVSASSGFRWASPRCRTLSRRCWSGSCPMRGGASRSRASRRSTRMRMAGL